MRQEIYVKSCMQIKLFVSRYYTDLKNSTAVKNLKGGAHSIFPAVIATTC